MCHDLHADQLAAHPECIAMRGANPDAGDDEPRTDKNADLDEAVVCLVVLAGRHVAQRVPHAGPVEAHATIVSRAAMRPHAF